MRLVGTLASPMVALGEQDGGDPRVNTSHLSQKEETEDKKAPIWHTTRKKNKQGAFDV